MGMSLSCQGMEFYNNLFYRCATNTSGPILFRRIPGRADANFGRVFNNAFVECGSNSEDSRYGWYSVDSGIDGFEADFNLVVGTGNGTKKTNFTTAEREKFGLNGLSPELVAPQRRMFWSRSGNIVYTSGTALNGVVDSDSMGTDLRIATKWPIGPFAQPGRIPSAPRNLRVEP
jgi:hypothetical protein